MSREEYDPTIEPNWAFDRSVGLWSYMGQPFEHLIYEGQRPDTSEGFISASLPSLSKAQAFWQEFLSQIPQAKSGCKGWLWQLSLDLIPMKAPVTDEGQLRACKWILSEFNKQVWALYRRKSLGAVIYNASIHNLGFYWDLEQLEQFIAWLEDATSDALREETLAEAKVCLKAGDLEKWKQQASSSLWARLYTLTILSQYWHYLASSLEEDCPALVQLDVTGLTLEEQLFLLARPLFDHVRLIAKGAHPRLSSLKNENGVISTTTSKPPKLALLAPQKMNWENVHQLALAMQALDQAKVEYKVIQEPDLVFEWQEVEQLIVFACEVSDLALRSLRGFKAASGEIYAIGKNPHLSNLLSQWPSSLAQILLTKEREEG
jgi:hypothetical protein